MGVSTLTMAVAKPNPLLQSLKPKSSIFTFKPTISCSSSSNATPPNLSLKSISMTKRKILDMGIGLLAASMVMASPLDANATRIEYYATVSSPPCEYTFVKSGLGYCDLALGTGDLAPVGELINIHYTARFADEIVFDSSYKRGRYLTMRIGVGKVLKGLDQGIAGGEGVPPMAIGGRRKLQIPPELAYGPEPAGCFSDCARICLQAKQNPMRNTDYRRYKKQKIWILPSSSAGSSDFHRCLISVIHRLQ